jgi:hypothetical protein
MERIISRLPHFYIGWDGRTFLFRLIQSIGMVLHQQQINFFRVQKSHWLDTSFGLDLDQLGIIFNIKRGIGELDNPFRERIRYALMNFKGGGTKEAIITQILHYFRLEESEVQLIENPEAEQVLELVAANGSTWIMRNRGIEEEEDGELIMTLEPTGLGGVANPTIMDVSNPEQAITYNGIFNPGESLAFKSGKVLLDGEDVSHKFEPLSAVNIRIPRRSTHWIYKESTSPKIGHFDFASFDDNYVFDRTVPTIRLTFRWKTRMAATFQVRVSEGSLERNGFTKLHLKKLVNTIKAAGIKAEVL